MLLRGFGLLQFRKLLLRKLRHIGLSQQLARACDIGQGFLIRAVGIDGRLQGRVLLQKLLPKRLVSDNLGLADGFGKLLVAAGHPIKFFKHGFSPYFNVWIGI